MFAHDFQNEVFRCDIAHFVGRFHADDDDTLKIWLNDVNDFADKLKPFANKLCGIEVLRYNTLAESKYIQIGKEYTDFGETQTDDYLLAFCDSLETALEHETKVYSVF